MDLEPFERAPLIIQVHVISACVALLIGTVIFLRGKGDFVHRMTGRAWVFLMAMVAGSGLFIFELRLIGPFSPVHLLSVLTLIWLFQAITAVRRGQVQRHLKIMRGIYFGGLMLAGAFTLLPGRLSYRVLVEPLLEGPVNLPVWWLYALAGSALAGAVMVWLLLDRPWTKKRGRSASG